MPLECQLSYLLSYLSKKWQSLSAKMFNIAQVDSTCAAANEKSQPPNRLEIHVPPEVSVKAKYQVHEVSYRTLCVSVLADNATEKNWSFYIVRLRV